MECADRNPKRSVEEVSSVSAEPPAYKQRMNEEENQRKRKAEEGGLQKEEGETRGNIDRTMDVGMLEEDEFQEKKKDPPDGSSGTPDCQTDVSPAGKLPLSHAALREKGQACWGR